MANSKYEGGSKVTTFRLPVKWFEEAKKTIDNYLKRFEGKPGLDRKIGYPVTPQEALVTEVKKKTNKQKLLRPDLVDELLKLDPKIIIPGETESAGFEAANPKEKLIVYGVDAINNVPEDHIAVVVKQGENGHFEWSCGCTADNNLFRRSDNCKLPILKHLK